MVKIRVKSYDREEKKKKEVPTLTHNRTMKSEQKKKEKDTTIGERVRMLADAFV